MKTLFVLSTLFALAGPVIAGEAFKGYRCENECPLAQQANSHRAFGMEALAASTAVRAYIAASVEKNLLKI
jgi:hypothetical protein